MKLKTSNRERGQPGVGGQLGYKKYRFLIITFRDEKENRSLSVFRFKRSTAEAFAVLF